MPDGGVSNSISLPSVTVATSAVLSLANLARCSRAACPDRATAGDRESDSPRTHSFWLTLAQLSKVMLLSAKLRGATRLAQFHTTSRVGITASAASPATTALGSRQKVSAPCVTTHRAITHRAPQQARLKIQAQDAVSPHLIDSFGRRHDYLRISLTEKCNLRCTYCMPEQGVPLLPNDSRLTAAEIERVASVFVRNGVRKIRLTGGEPTVRSDLVDIVERLGRLRQLDSLGITSNGIALKRKLPALVDAGLTHLNLSLDTLDPFKYELMTRRRGFDRVVEVLDLAQRLGGRGSPLRVKLNVVVIRGVNDDEVADFVALTRDQNITVRFIEYMPFEGEFWAPRLGTDRQLTPCPPKTQTTAGRRGNSSRRPTSSPL